MVSIKLKSSAILKKEEMLISEPVRCMQVDSLPAEPQRKPKYTGVGSLSYPFSSGSSRLRNQTRVSCIAGRFFTN